MKDLDLNYFLDLETSTRSDGYSLSSQLCLDLLSRSRLTDGKIAATSVEANIKLTLSDSAPFHNTTLYHQLVGSWVYLTSLIQDIAHAVHIVSQFMAASRSTCYAAILHILHCIKGSLFHCLYFST